MEVADNGFILIVPGAIAAGLGDGLFWWSLGLSLIIAFAFALPLNRWLIGRGKGHPSSTPTTPTEKPAPQPPGAAAHRLTPSTARALPTAPRLRHAGSRC